MKATPPAHPLLNRRKPVRLHPARVHPAESTPWRTSDGAVEPEVRAIPMTSLRTGLACAGTDTVRTAIPRKSEVSRKGIGARILPLSAISPIRTEP